MRAISKVLPHNTDKMGLTPWSKIKSSLSSTKVFLSTPRFMGIEWGVGYNKDKIIKLRV